MFSPVLTPCHTLCTLCHPFPPVWHYVRLLWPLLWPLSDILLSSNLDSLWNYYIGSPPVLSNNLYSGQLHLLTPTSTNPDTHFRLLPLISDWSNSMSDHPTFVLLIRPEFWWFMDSLLGFPLTYWSHLGSGCLWPPFPNLWPSTSNYLTLDLNSCCQHPMTFQFSIWLGYKDF